MDYFTHTQATKKTAQRAAKSVWRKETTSLHTKQHFRETGSAVHRRALRVHGGALDRYLASFAALTDPRPMGAGRTRGLSIYRAKAMARSWPAASAPIPKQRFAPAYTKGLRDAINGRATSHTSFSNDIFPSASHRHLGRRCRRWTPSPPARTPHGTNTPQSCHDQCLRHVLCRERRSLRRG